ncbi:hypothetical protein N9512_05275 [Amylibacter sp.]|nr:hypothetical protein [Amylibacter sp.]
MTSNIGGLELGLYYSLEYKKNENLRDNNFGKIFFKTLSGFNFILVILLIIFWMFWNKHLPELFPLIVIALGVEAISYEFGRFLWNLGEVEKVSKRDFLRPLIFTSSILVSVFLSGEILTVISLLIFIVGNTFILIYEARKHLDIRMPTYDISWIRSVVPSEFISKFFHRVGPQFLQKQCMSTIIILERLLFTITLGLDFLGIYVFIFNIINVLSNIIVMPKMIKVRKIIITDQLFLTNVEAYVESIKFVWLIIWVTLVIVVLMFVMGPGIADYFDKDLNFTPLVLITIGITSAIYNYTDMVAPLFCHKTRWFKSNMLTILGFLPIVITIYVYEFIRVDLETFVLNVILVSAILQIVFRLGFFISRVNTLNNGV